jgi:HK97 gp10 family phage protein
MAFGAGHAAAHGARSRRGAFIDISIFGDTEAAKLMRSLEPYLQKQIMQTAMKEAAKPMLAAAKQEALALTRGGGRMAAVAKLLKIQSIRRRHQLLGVRVSPPKRSKLGIPKTHKYYYPRVVEYGTVDTPPNPYLFRAFQRSKNKVFKIAKDLILKGVRLGWTRAA